MNYRELTLAILHLVERVRSTPSVSTSELSQQIAQALQGQQFSSIPSSQALPAHNANNYSNERWDYLAERLVYCLEEHRDLGEYPRGWRGAGVNLRGNSSPRMYPAGWKFRKNRRGFERMLVFKCPKCSRCCGLTLYNGKVVRVFQRGQIAIY